MAVVRRTRILIVDDSAVMRGLLRSVVSSDGRLEVAGTAADGASALGCLETARPDLILLDVEMPVMDGLVTLRQLRSRGYKMPVIMCSSLTQSGAQVTLEALAVGASDYVAKPQGQSSREDAKRALAEDLIPKIHALTSQAYPLPQPAAQEGARRGVLFPFTGPAAPPARPQQNNAIPSLLTIGVSTGGPAALDAILPLFPANFPLPILVVQHMPELFTRLLAERLNGRCPLRVREAAEGVPVSAGSIHIARGNWHMEVLPAASAAARPTLHLSQGPQENHCRPAADVLFRSAARVYGSGVVAVVLTGMGSDGLNGCRIIREQGGSVLAQDRATSTVWGMPGAVANAGLAHKVLPLGAIVPEVLRIAGRAPLAAEARRMVV
ncbi:MAG: chemotaxis response regulator protein-glutamate methylesterase [Terracidiphilus sp.]